jgi:hypothetical protein
MMFGLAPEMSKTVMKSKKTMLGKDDGGMPLKTLRSGL